ncbi:MAG: hypothetical protein LBI92_02230 [Azoarcus sp.]|nr:hypothetical protein [Azoarcus sp.]
MSLVMEEKIKRRAAKRKSVLLIEILQGKTTVSEASRAVSARIPLPGVLNRRGFLLSSISLSP